MRALAAAAPQILVISTEPSSVRLVEGWLSAADGFRTVSASGAAQGLKLIADGGIDLALVDLEAAKDEAFHFCESIRKDASTCRLPLIALAEVRQDPALELKGRELGINDYVRRPLEQRQLLTQIKNLLQISDPERDRWLLSKLAQSDRLVTLGQLAASVAHEINNPLAFILSNLNTLQNYFDDVKNVITAYRQGREAGASAEKELQLDQSLADVDALLRETADGSRRVRALVFELKSLSRPDSGELEPVDLAEVAASTLLLTERELAAHAHLVRALQPAPVTLASRAKLHQVVLNLLMNASQALDGKPPEECEIRVVTRTEGDQAVLSVVDTGCGIPKEQQARIFDLFFTTKPPSIGTGIGLSVCAMVVQRMGGRIDVESAPGRGSTFTIRVPTRPARAA